MGLLVAKVRLEARLGLSLSLSLANTDTTATTTTTTTTTATLIAKGRLCRYLRVTMVHPLVDSRGDKAR